jgi:hypothetical protein
MVLASGATVFLMWEECFRLLVKRIAALALEKNAADTIHAVFWFGRELLWWGLMSLMLAILFAFLVRSEVGLRLVRRIRRKAPHLDWCERAASPALRHGSLLRGRDTPGT